MVVFLLLPGGPSRPIASVMKIYYLEFRAQATPADSGGQIEEQLVRFWVVDRDPDGALRRAHHFLVQNDWQPAGLEQPPREASVPADDAAGEEAAGYRQARRYGIAMAVVD